MADAFAVEFTVRTSFKGSYRRARRAMRRDLVHAAGCTYRYEPEVCGSRRILPELLADARYLGVRIPRSLRSYTPAPEEGGGGG